MDNNTKKYLCMYLACTFTAASDFHLCRDELSCRRRQTHCPDTGAERVETVKSVYDSQLSVLKARPSNMVFQEDRYPSAAAVLPTKIGQDDEGM